jgi:hypothetical protein
VLFGWLDVQSEGGALVFFILYGWCSSGLITLPATAIAVVLTPDMRQYGVRLTMQLVPAAIGLLIGNPTAGAVLNSGWGALKAFSAIMVLGCTALTIAARVCNVGPGLTRRG